MLYSQASEVRGPPRTRSVCPEDGWLLCEATGFSGDEKYITVVKHVLPGEGGFPRSSLSSLFGQGSELADGRCLGFSGSPWPGAPSRVHLRESEPL